MVMTYGYCFCSKAKQAVGFCCDVNMMLCISLQYDLSVYSNNVEGGFVL